MQQSPRHHWRAIALSRNTRIDSDLVKRVLQARENLAAAGIPVNEAKIISNQAA